MFFVILQKTDLVYMINIMHVNLNYNLKEIHHIKKMYLTLIRYYIGTRYFILVNICV